MGNNLNTPVIFIGMHRSGTSMLGRLLENLGLFAGTRQDENSEALFFKQLNKWLMAQCSARWDMPGATHYLWENEELLTWIDDYLRYLLDSPRAIQFLGLRRYLTTSGITRLNMPWGWKDPRNTFTMPMWLRIFPEAKVVYIERHGVDVAQSLRVRSRKGFVNTTRKYRKYRSIVSIRPKHGGFIESPRCASLEGGFSLWQEYTNQATEIMQQLPNHRVLKLRYEQLLVDPVPYLRASAAFCGLDVSNRKIDAMTAGINGSRAYSYLNDPELRDFARDHQVALADRGYK
ncbi:MAG: sulfotransferase [Halothiobacillus sp.]|jgi:hypothetical protein|nr:sulfotransferase [Halothiobacillus sp.]